MVLSRRTLLLLSLLLFCAGKYAMILWQILDVENLGRVINFTSVPGCGLSCQVSGVGHLFPDPVTEGMSERTTCLCNCVN